MIFFTFAIQYSMMTHFIEISYTFVPTAVSADQRGVLRPVRDLLPGEVMLMMMMMVMR